MERKLFVNITIATDSGQQVMLLNFPCDEVTSLTLLELENILFDTKWYMYGIYDSLEILGNTWIIVKQSKTKLELVRSNIVKTNS